MYFSYSGSDIQYVCIEAEHASLIRLQECEYFKKEGDASNKFIPCSFKDDGAVKMSLMSIEPNCLSFKPTVTSVSIKIKRNFILII